MPPERRPPVDRDEKPPKRDPVEASRLAANARRERQAQVAERRTRRERRRAARQAAAQRGVTVQGLVLVDPDGGRWALEVDSAGTLSTTKIAE